MSTKKNNNINNKPKPFCKICFAAGKPEKEYTSHFVRSSTGADSKVICPTLLSINCRYCSQSGHTIKHCDLFKNRSHKPSIQVPAQVPVPTPVAQEIDVKSYAFIAAKTPVVAPDFTNWKCSKRISWADQSDSDLESDDESEDHGFVTYVNNIHRVDSYTIF